MQSVSLNSTDDGLNSSLSQVSTREIDPDSQGVKVVFCVRNEKFRLAYFLQYYRDMGVSEFFAIDNDSSDDTQTYLLEQNDVHVFYTASSYKESNAGRDWTTELANRYCVGNWCFTLDVDEFFLYPNCENIDINLFTSYLDRWKYKGVLSIFLDFYSKKPLSQVDYIDGSSTFDLCDYFDSARTYHSFETDNFPYFQIKGGIRQRKFWDSHDPKSGPSMRKIVLVKWNENFQYIHSTHSCSPIPLADICGVIAHFKFMSHFKEFSALEVKRNDRVQNSGDWKVYANKLEMEEDLVFYDTQYSVEYKGSDSLQHDGHFRQTLKYFDYCNQRLCDSAKDKTKFNATRKIQRDELMSEINASRVISYDQIGLIWSPISQFNFGGYGRNRALPTITRLEEKIDKVMYSKQWRLTYPLRKLIYRLGLADYKIVIEDNTSESIYVNFSRTYGSFWWDLLAPIRIVSKVIRRGVSIYKRLTLNDK